MSSALSATNKFILKSMIQQTVLITGAHGFLGKALVVRLQSLGYRCVALSREQLNDPTELKKFCSKLKPEYVFICHAYGNMHSQTDRQTIFDANIVKTFNLLEAVKDLNYAKIIYISSSSVNLPVQTLYSVTKKMTEKMLRNYRDYTIVQPFSITGVGEQKEHLIPTLIDAAYTGKPVELVLDPVHDYIDIEDTISALMSLKDSKRGLVRLGSGRMHTNAEVLNLVEQTTGKKINMTAVGALRDYDSDFWQASEVWGRKSLADSIKEQVIHYKVHEEK